MSYYQEQFGKTFAPLIPQSDQGDALPPSAPPPIPPNGLNPYLIPDGLSINRNLKFLPYRAYPMQIRLLDTYRRQALQGYWQPRWYTAPPDPSVPITAGDTLNYQLHVALGSVLWGYTFAVLPSTVMGDTALPTDLRIQLIDQCRPQDPIIDQLETASAFVANFTSGTPRAGFNFAMPPEPIVLAGTDLLVNIVNTAAQNRQCQLLLMCMEPAGSPR